MALAIAAGYLQSSFWRDYTNYLIIYDGISLHSIDLLPSLELGFSLLMRTFKALGLDYLSAITLVLWVSITYKLMFFRKYSPNFMASLLLYCSTFLLLHEATQVRVSIATTFLFYACAALAGGKRLYFLAFVLAATLFHYSSLAFIAIPMVFFAIKYHRVTPFGCWLAACAAGLVVFYVFWPLLTIWSPGDEIFNHLPRKLSAYLTYRTDSPFNFNKLFMLAILMALFVFSCVERYCFLLRSVCFSSFVLSFFSIVAFHQRDVLDDRFSELFLVPLVVFLPTYLSNRSDFNRAGIFVFVIIFLFVPVYFSRINLFYVPYSNPSQETKELISLRTVSSSENIIYSTVGR